VSLDSLLVANRGEIARRVLRGAREAGLRTVAVYVDADADAPFVADADLAVRLGTGYLDGAAVIEAALNSGARAIHPGYGFLSENAEFARAVAAAGLVWVGPPPEAIAAMGDKLAAKNLAASLGVATLAHTSDPARASEVGYPLLVKASAGGGGKGMRVVQGPEALEEAVAAARREALSGFGDDTVFLERYVERSRHIEIQILGDRHGHLVHLGERECSIQRRHQKLVEESPSPFVDDDLRALMGAAALTIARSIGYYSTGTVEFLVDDATREFFFLEVNTRLQVEHPVTEEVTLVDLVEQQLRVADNKEIDESELAMGGHAIEVRLCAEDPANGFLPATGTLHAFEPPADLASVRWESGVESGSVVGVDFDPLLAKVIAWGEDRDEAASRLARALELLHLAGVTTNRDFLVNVLRHPSFLAGDTTTDFIERCAPERGHALSDHDVQLARIAAAMWLRGESRADARVLASAPATWRNARLPDEYVELSHGGHAATVSYRARRDGDVEVDGRLVRVHRRDHESIDLEVDGTRWRSRVTRAGGDVFVQAPSGTVTLHVVPRFHVPGSEHVAGTLSAPMPGTVLDVRVKVGDVVARGATLAVIEAMKMEHPITAPYAGEVQDVLVEVGQQVHNGDVLMFIEETGTGT
jgi:propionyl-CoA carboxylase alpha chain